MQDDEEFCGFTADDIRRVSKRRSAVEVLRENLRKRSQPAASARHVNAQSAARPKTVKSKTVSPPTSRDKVVPSPPSSPISDSSPPRGTMKGNIKVRLLLGRSYKWLPTSEDRRYHGKSAPNKETKHGASLKAAFVKEKRKRQSLSESDESAISSSEESDVKYSLPPVTAPRRGRPLQPAALVRARARQLVSKARGGGLQVEKKASVSAVTRPWTPYWHGRLQLPTQSSRSLRKITINRRFIDDSYTSIGQPGLSLPSERAATQNSTEQHNGSLVGAEEQNGALAGSGAGSRVRGVGLLNRRLGSKPTVKPWRRIRTSAKASTAESSPQIRRSKKLSESAHASKVEEAVVADGDCDVDRTADKQSKEADDLLNTEAPWMTNSYKSIYSNYSKKGSMVDAHCYICDSSHLVLRHYMCRVPCCRACAKFYKSQCERETKLDDLTCKEQGEFAFPFTLVHPVILSYIQSFIILSVCARKLVFDLSPSLHDLSQSLTSSYFSFCVRFYELWACAKSCDIRIVGCHF